MGKKNKNDFSEGIQLYNLKSDVKEVFDVSDENPGIVKELLEELKEWQKNVFEGVKIFS